VKDVAMATLDSKLHVSGHSEDYRAGNAAIDALLQGRLGRKTLDWVYQTFELPRAYQVNAPLRFTDVAIGRKSIGEVAFKGKVNVADTTDLTIDARKTSNGFRLVRATLKDACSDVSFGGDLAGKVSAETHIRRSVLQGGPHQSETIRRLAGVDCQIGGVCDVDLPLECYFADALPSDCDIGET